MKPLSQQCIAHSGKESDSKPGEMSEEAKVAPGYTDTTTPDQQVGNNLEMYLLISGYR